MIFHKRKLFVVFSVCPFAYVMVFPSGEKESQASHGRQSVACQLQNIEITRPIVSGHSIEPLRSRNQPRCHESTCIATLL